MDRKKINLYINIILLFCMLSIVMTYPLALKIRTYIPGTQDTDEPFGTIWHFWWLKYSFQQTGTMQLMTTDMIAAPFGMDLAAGISYRAWEIFNGFLSILIGEIAAYNSQVIAGFILAGVFAFLLVRQLTGSIISGIFGGIIFSFSPYHFSKTFQQFSLFNIYVFPLFVLTLINLCMNKTSRNVIFLALSFCLVLLLDYYYSFFCVVIAGIMLIYLLFSRQSRILVNSGKGHLSKKSFLVLLIVISLLLGFLFSLPSTFTVLKQLCCKTSNMGLMGPVSQRPFENLFSQSARPLSYLLPATVHPIFGRFTELFIGSGLYGDSYAEHTLFLGWTALIFAFIAVKGCRIRKKPASVISQENNENFYIRFFLILGFAAWLFSQPPWWEIGRFRIFMPSFFIYKILPMFRAYCRFGIVLMLAVAVLAGYGLKFTLVKFKNRKIKVLLAGLFSGLVLFEFLNFPPFKVIDLSDPPEALLWLNRPAEVYLWLKKQPSDIVIAEYPLDLDGPNNQYKFNQTRHHKKIINATTPGTHANKLSRKLEKLGSFNTAKILSRLKVKYILVHTDWYRNNESMEEINKIKGIEDNRGLKFIKKFEDVDVYEVIANNDL